MTNKTKDNTSVQIPIECLGMKFPNDEARRAYFQEKLREKLKDPAFRNIEGFPLGEDEDILALSDAPYYTACPNPFLVDFIDHFEKKETTSDGEYHQEPFAADVSEGKHDPIYKAHTYHTKVPPKAIVRYLEHYTKPGDVILDPFCGSGMTGVAARILGDRLVIQCDLSPAATHISYGYAKTWKKLSLFKQTATELLEQASSAFADRYSAIINNKHVGSVKYWVWSDVLTCASCDKTYSFADAAVDLEKQSIESEFACPHCGADQSKASATYGHETILDPYLNMPIKWNKRQPFWIVYEQSGKRIKRKMNTEEIRTSISPPSRPEAINFALHPYMFREGRWGHLFRAGYHFGMTHSHHFYTWRNLAVLDHIWAQIKEAPEDLQHLLRFWFLATSMKCSRLMTYNADGIGRVMKGNLYISSLMQEVNPIHFLKITLRDMCAAMPALPSPCASAISTNSASQLPIPDSSIDYVFVDPPFGDNLIYSELNFLWECWLKVFTQEPSETIVNSFSGKKLAQYTEGMSRAFKELYRVLKPGRWTTIEFHNSKNSVWISLQEALERSGFVIADVRVLDKKHGSIKQVQTTGAVKKDLVISAYKPSKELEEHFRLEAGTEAGVWDFIRNHLQHLPLFVEKTGHVEVIAERQNYLLFDRMIAFHVQRGVTVPLSAPEFYAGLRQRFPERDEMYFLPDQVPEYDHKRLEVKTVEQLELFVSDERTAIQWVRRRLTDEPLTLQNLQPVFMREAQRIWEQHENPIELLTILEQNFVRDANGKWRVPDPKKEADLEQLRQRTLLKEFQQYIDTKGKLKLVRTEALRCGFKDCWQKQDYPTIVQVAKRIPEAVIEEDQALLMYYDNALLRIGE